MEASAAVALIVGIVSSVIAIVALVFAGIANSRAKSANQIATDANGIAAKALEHQKLLAPPEWGCVEPVPGINGKFRIENQSGRSINIVEFSVRPTDSAGAVTFRQGLGSLIDPGDAIHFAMDRSIADDPREVEIAWVYSDRTEAEESEGWNYLYRALI